MFFPVRCIFWMTVVYTSITWPGALPGTTSSASGVAAAAMSTATTAVTDVCLASPDACADKIAALSRLAEAVVPLPVARPVQIAPARIDTLRADDRSATPSRVHRPG